MKAWLRRMRSFSEGNMWTIGVFGVIIDPDGKVLLVKEGDGKWGLPGGNVSRRDRKRGVRGSNNDVFPTALFRELREEIGFWAGAMTKPLRGPNFFPSARFGDLALVFLIRVDHRFVPPKIGREICDVGWCPPEVACEMVGTGTRFGRMVAWAVSQT